MNENIFNNEDLCDIEKKTKLNKTLIIEYYKKFLLSYPNGRINKQKFIDDIVFKLIIDDEKNNLEKSEQIKSEKVKLCLYLFNICDQDESGEVDFIEVIIFFIKSL